MPVSPQRLLAVAAPATVYCQYTVGVEGGQSERVGPHPAALRGITPRPVIESEEGSGESDRLNLPLEGILPHIRHRISSATPPSPSGWEKGCRREPTLSVGGGGSEGDPNIGTTLAV